MARTGKPIGRPRKDPRYAAHNYLHVGLRFPPELKEKMRAVLAARNKELQERGLPAKLTISSLSAHWVQEHIELEYAKLDPNAEPSTESLKA